MSANKTIIVLQFKTHVPWNISPLQIVFSQSRLEPWKILEFSESS